MRLVSPEAHHNGTLEDPGNKFHNSGRDIDIVKNLCEYPPTMPARSWFVFHVPARLRLSERSRRRSLLICLSSPWATRAVPIIFHCRDIG